MSVLIYTSLTILGLCMGSFVNAFVWRLRQQELLKEKYKKNTLIRQKRLKELSVLYGRSMCSECGHPLAARDLIPVVSWLLLRGKCRYCHAPIDDKPFAEILVPTLFILSYMAWPFSFNSSYIFLTFVIWLIFIVGFSALAIYDVKWMLLPDRIVKPFILLALINAILYSLSAHNIIALYSAVLGAFMIGGFFFLIFQISKGNWIGGGDVKLGFMLGLLAGGALHSIFILFLASAIGTVVSLPLLISKRNYAMQIPFGPFLLSAAFIVQLYGDQLTHLMNKIVMY